MTDRAGSGFHAAHWDEPLIDEIPGDGGRGLLPPKVDDAIADAVGDVAAALPEGVRRATPPALPQVPQHRVLRHFLRLSQMAMGFDVTVDMMGTCTMKYSPKVHEYVARLPAFADIHPLQDPETLQGTLEILYRFNRMMCEIAGMDAFTFQPASGAQGIYTNACLIRAYHESCGDGSKRDEIITTAFSHPADAATPAVAGFKVITLMPGEMGFAEVDALKAAVSERTAGLMLTNPEDTGQYNPHIRAFVDIVHEAGGLCAYDQANGNPLLGIVRAGDTGFDMCQFNLHKTFSAPHGALGLGCAAVGVKEHLERFLPRPIVTYDGERYGLDHEPGEGIEKIRAFIGNVHAVLKAYAWVRSLGAEGLRAVAETAVLNNNYMLHNIRQIEGTTIPWPKNTYPKLEQVRYSWEPLYEETGVASHDVLNRMVDFGVQHYMGEPRADAGAAALHPGAGRIADHRGDGPCAGRAAADRRGGPQHAGACDGGSAQRRHPAHRRRRAGGSGLLGLHVTRLPAQAGELGQRQARPGRSRRRLQLSGTPWPGQHSA